MKSLFKITIIFIILVIAGLKVQAQTPLLERSDQLLKVDIYELSPAELSEYAEDLKHLKRDLDADIDQNLSKINQRPLWILNALKRHQYTTLAHNDIRARPIQCGACTFCWYDPNIVLDPGSWCEECCMGDIMDPPDASQDDTLGADFHPEPCKGVGGLWTRIKSAWSWITHS